MIRNRVSVIRGAVSDLDDMAIRGAKSCDLNAVARRLEAVADELAESTSASASAVKASLVRFGMKTPR